MAGKKPYHIINLILAGMIGLIFLYSGIFSASGDRHPFPSFYEEITGEPSPSSGMSRAFSEIIRGRMDSAREYNPDSLMIFAFFLIQGVQRLAVSLLLTRGFRAGKGLPRNGKGITIKYLLLTDVILSLVLFLFCFRGQILAMVGAVCGAVTGQAMPE